MSTFSSIVKSQTYENEILKLDLNNYDYDKDKMLSECQDVILEAERRTLNEDIHTIHTYTPSCAKKCAKLLDWKNESFWNDLPNPRNNSFKKSSNNPNIIESITKQCIDSVFGDLLKNNPGSKPKTTSKIYHINSKTHFLSKKYFNIWKTAVEFKREQNKQVENQLSQKMKLETFMKKLKKRRKHEKSKEIKRKEVEISDNPELVDQNKNNPKPRSNYKNRFDAQKTIIQIQKEKLEEQNKIIQELKLGIISDDLLKSIENTKINIREIFGNCSEKIKYKIPLILAEESRFSVCSHGAPKIVQKMERRAMERAQNREMILERKRLIEEARQNMLQKAIEKKRVLEEEEKKRSLELIKERRQKEMEMEKIRQANKQKYMEKLNKAVNFYNKLLLKQYLRKFYENMRQCREKYFLAVEHYENKSFKKCINTWQNLVASTYNVKYEMADAHFEYKALKRSLNVWRKVHKDSIRNMQVAEDFYDFRLTSNVFIHWNRYVCIQFMKDHKSMKKAESHYKRWLLFHYFFLWRSLKTVNELEKAKELKKAKWRQKVWEILPDYKPPEEI